MARGILSWWAGAISSTDNLSAMFQLPRPTEPCAPCLIMDMRGSPSSPSIEMKLKRGALVPWKGEVLQVDAVFTEEEHVRLRLRRDDVYRPELDLIPLEAVVAELGRIATFRPGDLVKLGEPWYGITRRYWSTTKGCVLYDLLEFGAKPGHRMDEVRGVEEIRLRHVWPDQVAGRTSEQAGT